MSTTVLPELALESVETADRLARLSGGMHMDAAEAAYILKSGVSAIQHVPWLWSIIRGRIAGGTTAATAHQLLTRLLDAVNRNLALAGALKEPARVVHEERGQESEAVAELAAAEEQVRAIRTEAARLLRAVDTPVRWPAEEQLKEAKEQMQHGRRLNEEEFRRALDE